MKSQNSRYFRVGLFVLGSLVIFFTFLITFTTGSFFQKSIKLETYFDESVQGLDIGSAVKHRGVKVGSVEEITFVQNYYSESLTPENSDRLGRLVLVRMSVPDFVKGVRGSDIQKGVERMIQNGLRVRLASQGLTGTAYLEVDYLNPERNLPLRIPWKPQIIYIPSAPSTISRFTASVDKFFEKLEKADVTQILSTIETILATVHEKVQDVPVKEISKEAIGLLSELRRTNQEIKNLVSQSEFQNTPKKLDANLNQMQIAIKRLDLLLANNQGDLSATVENLRKASEDLKEVTSNAKRYPSFFLIGEPPNQSKLWK